jgi:RNA polymerase sigma factor (sigma-70 family)
VKSEEVTMGSNLENLVELAKEGDREALKDLLLKIKDRVFGLAVRMLGHPVDAEDATQEILIKIITHLSAFRQESAFTSWVYRIAANYLLSTRKRRAELIYSSFDDYVEAIDRNLASQWSQSISEAEMKFLVEEMMISCTQGVLLCLDRDHRLAFILGEIFEVSGKQGGYILGITPIAFRKRLSRARKRINHFMENNCSLMNPSNPCTCERMVLGCPPQRLGEYSERLFTAYPCRGRHGPDVLKHIQEFDELQRVAVIFHSHPDYAAPETFMDNLKGLINSGRFELFNGQQ